MTAAISVAADLTYARAGVTLSGFVSSDFASIYRVHGDGTSYPVRTSPLISGGEAFAWDYECPFGQPVTYQAQDDPSVRTNWQVDPRFVNLGTTWVTSATGNTLTYDSNASAVTVAISASTGTNATYGYILLYQPITYGEQVAAGQVWSHSISVTNNYATAQTVTVRAYPQDTGAGTSDTVSTLSIPANTTQVFTLNDITITGSESTVTLYLYCPTSTPTSGGSFTITQPISEQAASVGAYFMGYTTDTPTKTYAWTGDPDNSPSTETTAAPEIQSASFTLPVTDYWLRCPGQPDLDTVIEVQSRPKVTYPINSATLQPLGKGTPVVVQGARGSEQFTTTIRTRETSDALSLLTMARQSATLLLVQPGDPLMPWQYVALNNVDRTPLTPWNPVTDTDAGNAQDWDCDMIVVDMPVGGMLGDSTDSYSSLLSAEATYSAVDTDYATYLDVLKGTG